MKTTNNGIKIPDNPNSSNDNIADIITAIITNGNAIDTMNGNISSIQTDYNQGYIKLSNGLIIQWGHPDAKKTPVDGGQATGSITFPKAFSHVCFVVVGSDAGAEGISFGFYGLNKNGCIWRTTANIAKANHTYSPNYIAFGF
jgi:hypothetical protein